MIKYKEAIFYFILIWTILGVLLGISFFVEQCPIVGGILVGILLLVATTFAAISLAEDPYDD